MGRVQDHRRHVRDRRAVADQERLRANERRTYEERLRSLIDGLAERHRQGFPIDLNRVPAIHFGRLTILRPEQYLVGSSVKDVRYFNMPAPPAVAGPNQPTPVATSPSTVIPGVVPEPFDEFLTLARPSSPPTAPASSEFNSFLLTQVEFDGDLRVYMRDIAEYLADAFDLIFENCEDFPRTRDFEKFWLWVRRYQINTSLFYAAYSDLSVARIKHLEAFKQRFDAFVAQVRPAQGGQAANLNALFDAFLRENQQIAHDFPTPSGLFRQS